MLIFFSFARRISSKVISLTCEIEPGAAVILSLYSVCMLSITRNLYSRSARLAKIEPRFISVNKKSSRSFAPSLSALSLIWLALSSPLTYRVGAFLARLLRYFCQSPGCLLLAPVSPLLAHRQGLDQAHYHLC